MIDVTQAQEFILNTTPKAKSESISIDAANGRFLAKDINSTRNQPPFNRVAMDGIAITTTSKKTVFPIEGVQIAGTPQLHLKSQKNCIEVMTGATLPEGCNCVIPYEKVHIENGVATIQQSDIKEMANIHQFGSDYTIDEKILSKGLKITSPVTAVLASQGTSTIDVYQNPKICIISTGTELTELDQRIEPHQIYMSNSYAIECELKNFGVTNITRCHIVDNQEKTEKLIQNELEKNDIIIITGGVSKGKFDFIPSSLESIGINTHFHKIKQKPGKPMLYGTRNEKQVFALPGNPVSCLICLRKYLIPSLYKRFSIEEKIEYGVLNKAISFKKPLTYFASVKKTVQLDGINTLTPIRSNGSGDFFSIAHSDGFIQLPENKSEFLPGEAYLFFPWFS